MVIASFRRFGMGLALCAYAAAFTSLTAQPSDQTFTGWEWVPSGTTDTMRSADFSASWQYETETDSTHTLYLITEFKKNGSRLLLDNWKDKNINVNWTETELRDSSRTRCFTAVQGDTISFFRQFTWLDRATATMRESNFYTPDTLDYAIELVKNSDGSRLALVDSIGVLRRVAKGPPTFYGTNARMALVKYPLPAVLGDSVYLRVRATQRGSGPYGHRRRDAFGVRLSERLNDTAWQAYAQALWRPVKELESIASGSHSLTLAPNPSLGTVRVSFDSEGSGNTAIAVYDAVGGLVNVPYMSTQAGRLTVDVTIKGSGTYYVVLLQGQATVAVQRVEVIK